MNNEKSHENIGVREASSWKTLGSFVLKLSPELVVAFLAFFITSGLNFFQWYYNITLSVLISVLYGAHNKAMLDRLKDKTNEGMKDLDKSIKILSDSTIPSLESSYSALARTLTGDVAEALHRLPKFVEFGCEIEKTKNNCDSEIANAVQGDQISLLQRGEHVLTLRDIWTYFTNSVAYMTNYTALILLCLSFGFLHTLETESM